MKRKYWRERQRDKRCKDKREKETALVSDHKVKKQKSKRKNKTKRELNKAKATIKELEKQKARYKKRCQRLEAKLENNKPGTPRTKTKMMLGRSKVSNTVRKTLVFHHALVQGFKEQYRSTKKHKVKNQMILTLHRQIIKKYHLKYQIQTALGVDRRCVRKKTETYPVFMIKNRVQQFLERDDNSRITTSKNDTITKEKEKRQRRILNDTMINLHLKFCCEYPLQGMSYSLFCRLRPFHIVHPTARDRDTCLCKLHENIYLKFARLKSMKLLPPGIRTSEECVKYISCTEVSSDCYERKCDNCREEETS